MDENSFRTQEALAKAINVYWAARGIRANARVQRTTVTVGRERLSMDTIVSDLGARGDPQAGAGWREAVAMARRLATMRAMMHGRSRAGAVAP